MLHPLRWLPACVAALGLAGVAQAFAEPHAPKLAYLDPVTGALIVQGVVAAIATIVVKSRSLKNKVRGWFGLAPASTEESTDTERRAS